MTAVSVRSAVGVRSLGERGAGKGGFPGPALSVRLFVGHALPTEKSQIPELLSEGGSESRSRLTVTVRASRFHAVALVWRAGKRVLKTAKPIGFVEHEPPGHATHLAGIGRSPHPLHHRRRRDDNTTS